MSNISSECTLSPAVETLISTICKEQCQQPPQLRARTALASITETEQINILNYIRCRKISKSFTGFILYKVNEFKAKNNDVGGLCGYVATEFSSSQGSNCVGSAEVVSSLVGSNCVGSAEVVSSSSTELDIADGRSSSERFSPHFHALEELEFRKLFLILSYIGRNKLENVASIEELQSLRAKGEQLSMGAYESLIWEKFGQHYVDVVDRIKYRDWDPRRKAYYYHCHVYTDGSYAFKGPYLGTTTTLLQRVLKDESVLVVKFADEARSSIKNISSEILWPEYHKLAEEGIFIGHRCYRFFVFKDGGKEMKKKDSTSSSVKCYFVNMDSFGQFYHESPSFLGKMSVHDARCIFMHAHTVESLSAYMARFSLILSKTTKLEVDMDDGVHIEDIPDIPCKSKDGSLVYGKDRKLLIQTDGTGFISEDLAQRCPRNCYKGSFANDPNFERYLGVAKLMDKSLEHSLIKCHLSEPPLLIQFRMFDKGRAVKGTVLVNKQLREKTIQIRPKMVKVKRDTELSGIPSINSFEIVSTSNKPKRPLFSRFLIALLHYGGVRRQFFTDILEEAVADADNVLSNTRGALRVALNHGETDDDFTVSRMLLSGIPLEEPYIQWRLPILAREEMKSLKEGRLPVKDSFYLMGTADPVDCLEENEVCIIHENGQISGDVLVYRNPGIHFGDIRVLKATHQTALEDVVGNSKYGIIFSTKGPRSLGDQMAGGDYDGDMYWVSRNPELLRYFKPSEPWACAYTVSNTITKKPDEYSTEEREHELFNMFLETRFNPSKSMGLAADSWLGYMDRMLTLGPECADERNALKEKMLRLVNIYYDALDAPKKGWKVDVPRELIPKKYPHYMGRHDVLSYKSKSVLGEIFDRVNELKLEEPSIQVWKLPNFEVEVPEDRMQLWEDHYKTFRFEMRDACSLAAECKNESARDVIQKYKQVLYGADDFEKTTRSWDDIRLDALALYHVTYNYAIKQGNAKYCGFAWRVAGPALLKVFIDEQDEKPVTCLLSVLRQLIV